MKSANKTYRYYLEVLFYKHFAQSEGPTNILKSMYMSTEEEASIISVEEIYNFLHQEIVKYARDKMVEDGAFKLHSFHCYEVIEYEPRCIGWSDRYTYTKCERDIAETRYDLNYLVDKYAQSFGSQSWASSKI